MKLFLKHIDWLISAALISWYAWHWNSLSLEGAIHAYLIVGGWQVFSMITHAVWLPPRKHSTRHTYHWISFICVITMPLGSYWILSVISPFMAVFYTILCIIEVFSIHRRPTTLLN